MTRGKAGACAAASAIAALAAGAAVASAGDGAHAAAVPHTTLHLSADPHGNIKFTVKRLSAKAGKVTLIMKNPKSAGIAHGVGVKGHGHGKVVDAGKTSTVTVTLKRGKYTFYCPALGHTQAGMKGTLTIK
jgi:uncharacterized cupredoxin-like copper-binding protein